MTNEEFRILFERLVALRMEISRRLDQMTAQVQAPHLMSGVELAGVELAEVKRLSMELVTRVTELSARIEARASRPLTRSPP